MNHLRQSDAEVFSAVKNEIHRQNTKLELIASENFVSTSVLEAVGSPLTNKYAEGYPGKRYYGGCQNVDLAEELAIERAKKLFKAEHANVQPHSGAQANMAAYFALLEYGDTVLAMSLPNGGHLTHGSKINFSGRFYNFITYGVDKETETIDYDQVEKLALAHKPKLIVAGASSYPRIIDFKRFRQIADKIGAKLVVDMAHLAGLIAADVHPSPIPYAEVVTSTTHKTLRGPRGGFILCQAKFASIIDSNVFPGVQGGPLMHVVAAKAVAFHEAMQPEFVSYQKAVLRNAKAMASELGRLGLRLVSGGTDTHLLLVDLSPIGITGRVAEKALDAVGITVNKNVIPFDPRPPQITSGIRLGTPAITSRGFKDKEIKLIARLIVRVLSNLDNEKIHDEVHQQVNEICNRFPVPGITK